MTDEPMVSNDSPDSQSPPSTRCVRHKAEHIACGDALRQSASMYSLCELRIGEMESNAVSVHSNASVFCTQIRTFPNSDQDDFIGSTPSTPCISSDPDGLD